MNKKRFYCLFIVALCAFMLQFVAACISPDSRIVATISNKEALTAEWIAGDDDRSLELKFNPSSYNADNIETVVSSSNSNVVLASGTKLSAIGPGTATISVAVEGTITDSVEVSVKARQSVIPLQSFSIENTSELATVLCGLTYKMVPSFTPAETYTKDNTTPTVEFGTEGILSYEGGYKLKALKKGSTSVSVTVAGQTVEFNVAVEIGVPTLEFTSDANFNEETCTYNVVLQPGEQSKTIALPQVTARNGEGNDISDSIVVDTKGITVTDGTVTLVADTYTIDYSVTDSRDATKSASKTLTIKVFDSNFAINPTYSDGTRMFAESVDESGKVSVTPARNGNSEREATFNIAAGTQYYAEATFTYNVAADAASNKYPMIGLAHFNALNTNIAEGNTYDNAGELIGRRCIESVLANSGKFLIKDLKSTDAHWFDNIAVNIYLNSKLKTDVTQIKTMTIAIARNGNTIYTFVDGKLVDSSDIAWDYCDGKLLTTPGIISCGNANEFTASNITVLSGTEALTKLNEVTAAASIFGNNPTYPSTVGYDYKTYREYLGEDGNVKIKSDRGGEIAATFNIKNGTQYYAEATFTYNVAADAASGSYPMIGLAHFTELNTTVNTAVTDINNGGERFGRRCIESVLANNGKFFIRDLKKTETHWYDNNTTDNIYLNSTFKADVTQIKTITIAIARNGDTMYTFVDGVLIQKYAVPADYSGNTTPGIITCGNIRSFTASNIQLLSGTDAQAKITELTPPTNA